MTKFKTHIILLVSIAILASIATLSSCKKDRSMEAIITVRWMVDTMVVIPNCRVQLKKDDIEIVGYTDARGEYRYTFEQPVQLEIRAANDSLAGVGVIGLGNYGQSYYKTVFVF